MSELPTGTQTVRREGEFWTFAYGGTVCRIKDSKGVWYLALLLARPGERLSAVTLLSSAPARIEKAAPERPPPATPATRDDAGAARAEQARVNVTRALRTALQRIAADHPALGLHLERSIRTGTFCSYTPDPRLPIGWRCEG
jgi:hypothetical protein